MSTLSGNSPSIPAARLPVSATVRSLALTAAPAALLIGALCWPLVFSSSYFTQVWLEHLWLMWRQSLAIRADHAPTLFLQYPLGTYYPHYAFYGGTLYALVGTVSLLLGNAPLETYVLTYLLGFAAAYGGWWWLAHTCGVGRWWAHVPGVVFVTSPYYLTLIYERGDWPEFIGVSMIPLALAAAVSVLRADRLRAGPALALTVSCVLFFGSHLLTAVWGTTVVVLLALAILLCVPAARRLLTRAGIGRTAGVVVPAALLSAWFLLPTLSYGADTFIGSEYPHWEAVLREGMHLVSAAHLFTISRASAATPGTAFALSLPVLAIAWALGSVALALRGGPPGAWRRVLVICAVATALMIVLMTHAGLILALPHAYSTLQFSYRLESYVLLTLCGALLAGLVLARAGGRRTRAWRWMVAPVVLVAVVGAIQQVNAHSDLPGRNQIFGKLEPIEKLDYDDARLTILNYTAKGHPPEVNFPYTQVHDNRVSEVVRLPPHQLVYTNLQTFPSLVHVTGARIAGIDNAGYDVLEVLPPTPRGTGEGATPPAETISVSPADPLPVTAGQALSLAALAALLLQFGWLAVRRRRGRPTPATPPQAQTVGTEAHRTPAWYPAPAHADDPPCPPPHTGSAS